MKTFTKRFLSTLLAVLLLLTAMPLSALDLYGLFSFKASAADYQYIQFGNYPQAKVTDSATLSALDAKPKNWVSYGYYSGTGTRANGKMTPKDYMKYCDLLLNGTKYRAVTFTAYRPCYTGYTSSTNNSYQDDNGYYINNVYYFKYEPLTWRVLDAATGLILCENIIDSQAYNNYFYSSGTNYYGNSSHYANDYYYSSLRQWLNDDFYNTAFNDSQKRNIQTTYLNDANSSENKVFLLSRDEAWKTAYGFSSSDTHRAQGTAYAKCQGLQVSTSSSYYGNSLWWLRSAGNQYGYVGGGSSSACYVDFDGNVCSDAYGTDFTYAGIRPALKILNLQSDISQSAVLQPDVCDGDEHVSHRYENGICAYCGTDLSGYLLYTVQDETVSVVGYEGNIGELVLPDTINDLPLTSIASEAFLNNTRLQSIVISANVTDICDNAFANCTSLKDVVCEGEKTQLAWRAFYNCKELENIVLPKQLETIGTECFYGCAKLQSITLPATVKSVASFAFYDTDLKTVFFEGAKAQWDTVVIGSNNAVLKKADLHCTDKHFFDEGVVTKEPTCVVEGAKIFTCFCGETKTEILQTLPHDLVSSVTGPTCTEKGYTTHTCKQCDFSSVDTFVNELGHDYKGTVTKPTCIEQGYTTYVCARCSDKYVASHMDELGHDYKSVTTAPTCTEKGYTTHTCTRCNDSYVDTYVDELGHDYKGTVTPPTCNEQGYTTHTCIRCNDSYVDGYVDELGHDYQATVTPPTCTEQGYTTHICARCEDSYVDSFVQTTSHNYKRTVTEPTCDRQGFTTYTCIACGDTYKDSYVDALGHAYKSIVTAPTCLTKGYTTHICHECNNSYVDTYVDALGHAYKSIVTAPTCLTKGYTTHICHECNNSYVDTYVDALGHSHKITVTPSTCTEQGYTTHICVRCEDSYVDSYTAELGHSYKNVVTAPTCTERGYTTHTCNRCGDSYVDTYVSATGHHYMETVTAATCTQVGVKTFTCTCGASYTETLTALGHDYKTTVTAPACTERGYTTHICNRCGDSYVDTYVNATGHRYTETVTAATCTQDGVKTFTCACGASYTETLTALGHDYKATVTAPTCTERGYTTHTCNRCGYSYVDSYVNAKGHTAGEWKLVKEATYDAEGKECRYCITCGAMVESRTIPKVHRPVETAVQVNDLTVSYKKSEKIPVIITAEPGYTVTYTSSNPKVATVDASGKVTATGKGTATITCTVTDSNGKSVSDTADVTVKYTFGQWLIVIILFGWIWY